MKCEICGEETEKLMSCALCGRKVCSKDFDKAKGICEVCRETLCEICALRLAIGICNECGRLVCEDCSVKVGAGYLCRECLKGVKGGA